MKNKKSNNDPKTVANFLKGNRILVFSTYSWDSEYPESAMVYYLLDENMNILLLTSPESRKIKNIEKNNKVSLLIGQEVEPVTLQIQGTAQVIDEMKTIKILNSYLETANKNPASLSFPPLTQLTKGKGVKGIKVKIVRYKYSNFTGKDPIVLEGDLIYRNDILKQD